VWVNQPSFVEKRSEINRQPKYKLEERRKFEPSHVDSHLKTLFPLRQNANSNYVLRHQLGFQSKENTDLFQHYYRIFKKNKYILEKALREALQLKKEKLEEKDRLNLSFVIKGKLGFPIGDSDLGSAVIEDEHQNEEAELKLVPLEVKEFIIDCYLNDYKRYEFLVQEYAAQKLNDPSLKFNYFSQKSNTIEEGRPHKTIAETLAPQRKIHVLNLNSETIPLFKQTHEQQDRFLMSLIARIQSKVPSIDDAEIYHAQG
jgi:hypothetical protein